LQLENSSSVVPGSQDGKNGNEEEERVEDDTRSVAETIVMENENEEEQVREVRLVSFALFELVFRLRGTRR